MIGSQRLAPDSQHLARATDFGLDLPRKHGGARRRLLLLRLVTRHFVASAVEHGQRDTQAESDAGARHIRKRIRLRSGDDIGTLQACGHLGLGYAQAPGCLLFDLVPRESLLLGAVIGTGLNGASPKLFHSGRL